jgi:hypothetical protein
MRTTLTIDEDLAAQIEDLRRREGQSLKRVINSLLREGLRSRQQPPEAKKYRSQTRALRMRPGYDPAKLNQLVDELEAEEHRNRKTGNRKTVVRS